MVPQISFLYSQPHWRYQVAARFFHTALPPLKKKKESHYHTHTAPWISLYFFFLPRWWSSSLGCLDRYRFRLRISSITERERESRMTHDGKERGGGSISYRGGWPIVWLVWYQTPLFLFFSDPFFIFKDGKKIHFFQEHFFLYEKKEKFIYTHTHHCSLFTTLNMFFKFFFNNRGHHVR